MRKITVDEVLGYGPCDNAPGERYCRENLEKLFGEGKTALEICQEFPEKDIPISDIFWLIFRPEIIQERELHLLKCDFAEHVLPIWEQKYPDDKRPHRAIQAKRLWIDGKISDEELEVAWDAAWKEEQKWQLGKVIEYLEKFVFLEEEKS